MAGTASIFRITTNGDTEATARTANQIVEFNGTSLNPDDQSSLTSMDVAYTSDMSFHPNPDRHLSLIQDGKLGTIEVILRGVFTTPDTATGINRFQTWMIEDKVNASLPYGRFGLRYDNMSQFDLVPTSTTAYYLYDFKVTDVEEFQGKATFEARLYKNGTA